MKAPGGFETRLSVSPVLFCPNPFSFKKSHLPKLYVNITDTFKKKIEAIKAFESQKFHIAILHIGTYIKAIIDGLHVEEKFHLIVSVGKLF